MLRLGAIYTIGPYLLPRLVPMLMQGAPRMPLVIEENFTVVLAERLKHAELDLILISLPFDVPGIVTLPLYEEEFVVLLPVGHPWVEQEAVEAEALGGERVLLLGPDHCFRDQIIDACPQCLRGSALDGFQRNLEGSSLETIRCMVASNLGITILPCSAALQDDFAIPVVCPPTLRWPGSHETGRAGLAQVLYACRGSARGCRRDPCVSTRLLALARDGGHGICRNRPRAFRITIKYGYRRYWNKQLPAALGRSIVDGE